MMFSETSYSSSKLFLAVFLGCALFSLVFWSNFGLNLTWRSSSKCSDGFVAFEKTNSCYKLHQQNMSAIQAFEICFIQDSLPVSIINEEENNFVAAVHSSSELSEFSNLKSLWIGLINYEGRWHWMYPTPLKYTNWAPGSPDKNDEAIVTKMTLGNGNKWKNVNPGDSRHPETIAMADGVVCKKPTDS